MPETRSKTVREGVPKDDAIENEDDEMNDEVGGENKADATNTAAKNEELCEEDDGTTKGQKRKKGTAAQEPNKAQKTSETEATRPEASPAQVLKLLLSDAALDICRPEDERKDLQERGKDIVTYSALLSPFEELLCAVILSRPISHRLGLRSIRTIFNPPYSFRNAEAIKKAGSEKVHQALWDARTQHKGKTADEITLIADAVSDNDWSNDLRKIREKAKETVEEEREILRSSIKGLGNTGLDIFYRRIQWRWEEAFPFVDARTKDSIEMLGLPSDADELVQIMEQNWGELKFEDAGEFGEEERKRRAFVLVLERAVGSDLEKKTNIILEKASKV